MIDRAGGEQVAHGDFHQLDDAVLFFVGVGEELLARAIDHVDVDERDRAEAAALDQNRLLVQHFRGLQHVAIRADERGVGESLLDELQRHEAVIDVAE